MAPFKFPSQTLKGSKGCNLYYPTLWYQGLNLCDGGERTLKDEAASTSTSHMKMVITWMKAWTPLFPLRNTIEIHSIPQVTVSQHSWRHAQHSYDRSINLSSGKCGCRPVTSKSFLTVRVDSPRAAFVMITVVEVVWSVIATVNLLINLIWGVRIFI